MSTKRAPAGSPDGGGRFVPTDNLRAEQGQLDFGDFQPQRAERTGPVEDGRDIITDEAGVQHFPDGEEQHPLF